MSLMDLLSGAIDSDTIKKLSSEIGADEESTKNAMSAALPMLMGAVAKQTEDPAVAEELHSAIQDKKIDDGILDNLDALSSGSNMSAGADMLSKILGGNQARVENGVAQSAGLSSEATGKLMAMVTPLLMGAIGKQQNKNGFSAGDLVNFIGRERDAIQKSSSGAAGMLSKLFDADGDGDLDMKDLIAHGTRFFKR